MKRLSDVDLMGKRVLVRVDFNVPLAAGAITNDQRIRSSLPTIAHVLESGAGAVLVSHLGRPKEGVFESALSLAPVADRLQSLLGRAVRLERDWKQGLDMRPGDVILLENIRFEIGERANDPLLSKRLAGLCDVFVMDAFASSHRAHASTFGAGLAAPVSCAGLLLTSELDSLGGVICSPRRPLVAVVGGAKVSTKLEVLESLAAKADHLVLGGGMANTLLLALGYPVGASLAEPELRAKVMALTKLTEVFCPHDVVAAREQSARAPGLFRRTSDVRENEFVLDIGPSSAREIAALIGQAGTVLWNGPLGMFELDQFGEATRVAGEAIAESSAFSVAGGGDTIAAIEKYDLAGGLDYISTAGGAFLEYLGGGSLPALSALG